MDRSIHGDVAAGDTDVLSRGVCSGRDTEHGSCDRYLTGDVVERCVSDTGKPIGLERLDLYGL